MSDIYWNPTTEVQGPPDKGREAFLKELYEDRWKGRNLPEDLSGYTTEEMRNWPASTIRAFSRAQLHSLTDIQLKALTLRQLRALQYRGLQGRQFQALLANPHVDDILEELADALLDVSKRPSKRQ